VRAVFRLPINLYIETYIKASERAWLSAASVPLLWPVAAFLTFAVYRPVFHLHGMMQLSALIGLSRGMPGRMTPGRFDESGISPWGYLLWKDLYFHSNVLGSLLQSVQFAFRANFARGI
jgi:hypothetical protein